MDFSPIIISVTVATASRDSVLYVNSKETRWGDLRATLRSQLEIWPRWIVYVEGRDDVPWAHVANAIDVARGLHAEVVLLTPTPENKTKTKKARTR